MYRILIVEDDKMLNSGIAAALKGEDMEFLSCYNLRTARELLSREQVDLVLLDVNLPDGKGTDLLVWIKERQTTPVILLTANDMELDVVAGFSLGADDYVTKPFSLAILRARVLARLRRKEDHLRYRQGAFLFDFENLTFRRGEQRLELSRTEQRILWMLVKNAGHPVPRERLQSYVWDDTFLDVDENALSVAVNRLRTKLGDKSCIRTVYGIGYCWEVEKP